MFGFGVAFAVLPDQRLGFHQQDVGEADEAGAERVAGVVAVGIHLLAFAVGLFPRGEEFAERHACIRGDRIGVAAEYDVPAE